MKVERASKQVVDDVKEKDVQVDHVILSYYTLDPCLSEFIRPWVCSDNWKVRIFEAHTFAYRSPLIKPLLLTKHSN